MLLVIVNEKRKTIKPNYLSSIFVKSLKILLVQKKKEILKSHFERICEKYIIFAI